MRACLHACYLFPVLCKAQQHHTCVHASTPATCFPCCAKLSNTTHVCMPLRLPLIARVVPSSATPPMCGVAELGTARAASSKCEGMHACVVLLSLAQHGKRVAGMETCTHVWCMLHGKDMRGVGIDVGSASKGWGRCLAICIEGHAGQLDSFDASYRACQR